MYYHYNCENNLNEWYDHFNNISGYHINTYEYQLGYQHKSPFLHQIHRNPIQSL